MTLRKSQGVGTLTLRLLCNYVHSCTISVLLIDMAPKKAESSSQDVEGIFNHSTGMGGPVIEDYFVVGKILMRVWFHHVGAQHKGIVSYKEITSVLVIKGKRVRVRHFQSRPLSSASSSTG